jgi:hypothetical protein
MSGVSLWMCCCHGCPLSPALLAKREGAQLVVWLLLQLPCCGFLGALVGTAEACCPPWCSIWLVMTMMVLLLLVVKHLVRIAVAKIP